MRILLAEDERPLARAVIKILEKNNYSADAVHTGFEALEYIASGNYDAAILDIMMPQIDGIAVLKTLREQGSNIPILILTAKVDIEDKVLGLDSGANYYLTKPFDARELLAAIRTITRTHDSIDSRLRFGNISLDRATFELSSAAGRFRLANREFQIMEMLMSEPRRNFSSEHLMEHIWGFDSDADMSVVWVYISYLRKKLTALHADIQIKAYRNLGYALEEIN